MINHAMTLDGSNVIYANEFVKLHGTGNTTITDTINTAIVGAGGISQTDVDNAIAPLITKDVAHDTNIQANTDATCS